MTLKSEQDLKLALEDARQVSTQFEHIPTDLRSRLKDRLIEAETSLRELAAYCRFNISLQYEAQARHSIIARQLASINVICPHFREDMT